MAKTPSASARMPQPVFARRRFRLFLLIYIVFFAVLAAAYIAITVAHAPDKGTLQQLNLTEASYHWLLTSILLVFAIIWITSIYGSLVFKSYSLIVKKSSDGRALNIISNGLLVLALAQPVSSLIASIDAVVTKHHPELLPKLTIFNNYVTLILMGVSMVMIAIGAEQIYRLAKTKAGWLTQRVWVIGFIILSSLYSYFIVTQPIHTPMARRVYFLPNWLLVCSIAIPYIIFWYLGLNAAYQIMNFQRNIRGWFYKSAIGYLAAGIAAVIVSSIVTRVLTTVSAKLSHLSLTPLLFIVYGLLIIDAVGFVLIAIGAHRLRKIEEV